MPCNAADLAEVELFELLDETELRELAAVIDYQSVAAGEIIFHAGDLGDSLYIVKSGEVELFVKDTTGQKIVLTTVAKMTCLASYQCSIRVHGQLHLRR